MSNYEMSGWEKPSIKRIRISKKYVDGDRRNSLKFAFSSICEKQENWINLQFLLWIA